MNCSSYSPSSPPASSIFTTHFLLLFSSSLSPPSPTIPLLTIHNSCPFPLQLPFSFPHPFPFDKTPLNRTFLSLSPLPFCPYPLITIHNSRPYSLSSSPFLAVHSHPFPPLSCLVHTQPLMSVHTLATAHQLRSSAATNVPSQSLLRGSEEETA